MSFLSRVLVIIGLSFVMTLILMLIHWEPESAVADNRVETTAPAPMAPGPGPAIGPVIDRTRTSEASHDEGIDPAFAPRATAGQAWVMQDAQDIEELPAGVRAALAGCLVPRSPEIPNVISGNFKQADESRGPQRGSRAVEADLAVLCVRGPQAVVYVFWGAAAGGSDAVEAPPSLGVPVASIDFTPGTYIRTAAAADIGVDVRRELPIEPGMPQRISHDGIQLGNGCCATTHYWHRGRWRAYGNAG